MNEVFGDMISEESMKNAKNRIRSLNGSYHKLNKEAHNASVGLEKLLDTIKHTKKAMSNSNQPELIQEIHFELNKIAYLMEDFISEFKPMYDEINNRYIIEQMSGTFEKKEQVNYTSHGDSAVYNTINLNYGWDKEN
jgi:hypothetical protein